MDAAIDQVDITYVPITDLKPFDGNPRQITDEEMAKLRRSIAEFGFVDPVIARRSDNLVIGGHQRLIAAKQHGIDEAPVIYIEFSDAKATALNLALNKISGEWDWPKLANVFEELKLDDEFDIEITGFEMKEVDDIFTSLEADQEVIEDEVPEPPEEPITQAGDLWLLGEHRLLCGDSTNKDDVNGLMDGSCATLTITDPPYNVGIKYGADTNDNQSFQDYQKWTKAWAMHCPKRKILTVGIQRLVWWDSLLGDPQWIIAWIKRNGQGNTKLLGTNKWDAILVYNVIPDRGIDIIELNNDYSEDIKANGLHPTAKPVQLFGELIKRFSKRNELCYEPFSGTGTTLIAAEQLNRKCYAMEIEPKYCDVAVLRWENLTGRKAERISKEDVVPCVSPGQPNPT